MESEDSEGARGPSRIIIADDHPLFRSAIKFTLEAHRNLEVIGEAANGREALKLCRRLRPELVLMDLKMPLMDGVAATRAIKKEFPETLVLILTNWSAWEPFAVTKDWVMSSGDGEKTVYVQFKDAAGNESDTAQDTIVLDQTAPVVSSTDPRNNATGITATANISATFSESGSGIDAESLSTTTFQVVQLKPTGNVPISSGTFSLNEGPQGFQTVTFDPSSSLARGLYRVNLTTGVADIAGNALASDYTWQFATVGPTKR